MKKLLFPIMALAGLFLVAHIATKKRADPDYLATESDKLGEISTFKIEVVPTVVKKINRNSEEVHTFLSDIEIRLDGCFARIVGAVAYEKPKNFRMNVHSRFGKELDIGSNRQVFWFWSKRLDPPELHYADHSDLSKSRLKTPLNPSWIMESLNFQGIDTKNATYGKIGDKIAVSQERTGAAGEGVKVVTLLDENKITGRYLYSGSRLIAASEIKNSILMNGVWVPEKIVVVWKDEKVAMEWKFSNQKINSGIEQKVWSMPESKRKINMGK